MQSLEDDVQISIDEARIRQEMQARGFATAKEFAEAIGVHRNTIGNYLSGKAGMPNGLARILRALDLTPADVLSLNQRRRRAPGLAVAPLVDELLAEGADLAIVLFGSRARGDAKPYSDYDLGVFRVTPLEFSVFSRLLDVVNNWNEASLLTVQLVNLTHADVALLSSMADDLTFLAGSYSAWLGLLQEARVVPYE